MSLERINLNVPPAARKRLRAFAKRLKQNEAETARALLLEALDRAEREEWYRLAVEEITPAFQSRLLDICRALDKLDEPAR
jgi:hypothetical protein